MNRRRPWLARGVTSFICRIFFPVFLVAPAAIRRLGYRASGHNAAAKALNAELLKKAADKVGNPNILVNLVSRRVRQLNATGGTGSRPLLMDTSSLGAADIALAELVEEKMAWEKIEVLASESTAARKRRRG